jgi:hypothetical protein
MHEKAIPYSRLADLLKQGCAGPQSYEPRSFAFHRQTLSRYACRSNFVTEQPGLSFVKAKPSRTKHHYGLRSGGIRDAANAFVSRACWFTAR